MNMSILNGDGGMSRLGAEDNPIPAVISTIDL